MNTRRIKPVEFWNDGNTKEATSIRLYNFHGYNFDGSNSIVSYKLECEESFEVDGGESIAQRTSLFEGSVSVPDDVVQSWGADDEPIFDFVIGELNLEYDND